MRRVFVVVIAAIPCLSTGCWVPVEQGRAMEADIVRLKSEVDEQKRLRAADQARADREQQLLKQQQEAALRKIDAKIKEVGDTLTALNHAARKTGADLAVELDKTRDQVDHLRGEVEEAQHNYQTAQTLLAQMQATLTQDDQRLQVLEAVKKAADAAAAKAAAAAAAARQKALWRPNNKADYYKMAKEKLDQGDTATARQWFTEFLGKYKNDPLDAAAQYWIGDSYYQEQQWMQALFEFRKVADQYSKSAKAPDALLMIGNAELKLGHTDDAKTFFQLIGQTYPRSHAAKAARKKLTALRHRR